MPVINSKSMSFMPFKVSFDGDINQLMDVVNSWNAAEEHEIDISIGSDKDDSSLIGSYANDPLPKGVAYLDTSEHGNLEIPPRLRFRVYWNSYINRNDSGESPDSDEYKKYLKLEACDFIVYKAEADEDYTLLCTTINKGMLRKIAQYLEKILNLQAENISYEQNTFGNLIDSKFFTWLIYRFLKKEHLNDFLTITKLGRVSSKDRMSRGSDFSDGIDDDRVELMILLLLGQSSFGPIQLLIDDAEHGVELMMTIHPDGGFAFKKTESEIDERVYDELDGISLKYLFVDYYTSHLFKSLIQIYSSDAEWVEGMKKFVDEIHDKMIETLENLEREASIESE